ncbi:MAG: hypothetical protein K6T83_22235 [Alicyclobacillus sp.]|nr:hypothetical protein [Alicyclobacillus sp.]
MSRQVIKAGLATIGALCLFSVNTMPVFGATQMANDTPQSVSLSNSQIFTPSPQAEQFVNYMITSGLIKEFTLGSNGRLTLKEPLSLIQQKYHLDSAQMSNLEYILNESQEYANISPSVGRISPQLFYKNGIIYFTHSEVVATLFAAASLGPEAVVATLETLGTLTGGPIGTAIVAILSAIGAPALSQFTYYIIQAYYNDEGVYIGISWNGIFPNIVTGTWK